MARRTYRGHPEHRLLMPFRLKRGEYLKNKWVTLRVDLLTVHNYPHILDETMNNLEGLCRGYPSLILGESIQPLEYHFDVLLSKNLLNKLFCSSSQVV